MLLSYHKLGSEGNIKFPVSQVFRLTAMQTQSMAVNPNTINKIVWINHQ